MVATQILVAEGDDELPVLLRDGFGQVSEVQLDAVVGERLPQGVAERLGLVGQHVVHSFD